MGCQTCFKIWNLKYFDTCDIRGHAIVKILIIGEANSGKSSIVLKYADGIFDEGIPSTVGVDFKLKNLQKGEQTIEVQLWDTGMCVKIVFHC